MSQQLEQAKQQIQELQKQLQQAGQQVQQVDQAKMQHEAEMKNKELELAWFEAKNDKKFKDDTVQQKREQVQAEVAQLYDSNPRNDEIKNV